MFYAMSDIHGHLDALEDALKRIPDLEATLTGDPETHRLIFLGDYVDQGPHSRKVLQRIYDLQTTYPGNVVVIKGNHDEWFIEFLTTRDSLATTTYIPETLLSFLNVADREAVKTELADRDPETALQAIRNQINADHPQLVRWLKNLPTYWKTPTQVFVHAGIDEDAQEYWELGTSEDVMLNKFPATTVPFLIDIIAGHVGTYALAGDQNFHDVYFDGSSHYLIDGTVQVSGRIPVLTYDPTTGRYGSL
ncbi:metallophosphoesterase [uncultured Mobiluncus sp.]|uniref:metallophosphoesterase n=1 Tax=uncultured Mobiluncus sp. TaxID=293425 RepID=UPI0027D93635|nr:metallophosphoesterase [uncultured Mobiluncus sp.]